MQTKEELAAVLTGREYGSEITSVEISCAKAAGLVVVFGYSDDNVELRGAIDEEIGAYNGTTIRVTPSGIFPEWETFFEDHQYESEFESYFVAKRAGFREIEACWAAEGGYSWTFKTDIPHATFEIVEDGEPYCRGIVFALADVVGPVQA